MRTLVYLCYGEGPHVRETMFSLLTAFHFGSPQTAGFRYVIYTDQPSLFAPFGVELRVLSDADLEAWLGGGSYKHRRKTACILDALERFAGVILFVDCDTYFIKSPEALFDRIGPGRSCLHALERPNLARSASDIDKALHRLVSTTSFKRPDGGDFAFPPDLPMWNTGVVGLHAADVALIRDTLCLTDQIGTALADSGLETELGAPIHHIEQFATGLVLQHNSLSEAIDVVFHYWQEPLRSTFRAQLSGIDFFAGDLSSKTLIRQMYDQRPRPGFTRRMKQSVRYYLRAMHLPVPGVRASA